MQSCQKTHHRNVIPQLARLCARGQSKAEGYTLHGFYQEFRSPALKKFSTAFFLQSYGFSQTQAVDSDFSFFFLTEGVKNLPINIQDERKKIRTDMEKLVIHPPMHRNAILTVVSMAIYNHIYVCWESQKAFPLWEMKYSQTFSWNENVDVPAHYNTSTSNSSAATIWVIAFNWLCGMFYSLKLSVSKCVKLQTMQKHEFYHCLQHVAPFQEVTKPELCIRFSWKQITSGHSSRLYSHLNSSLVFWPSVTASGLDPS